MRRDLLAYIIKLRSSTKQPFEVKVGGSSMMPVILPTDTAVVLKSEDYTIGDVLLFLYEDNHIIIHRLLKILNGMYYCKGDNSFRIEIIQHSDILGKVLAIKRQNTILSLPPMPIEYLDMSYSINQEFIKNGYDTALTKKTPVYLKYQEEYLNSDVTFTSARML